MCGRYANHVKAMHGWKGIIQDWPSERSRYNVAPTTQIPTTTADGLRFMRWGLVPTWSKEPSSKYNTFNAKLETVAEKPTFRGAWKAGRRCLVPAQGYYEWRTENGTKQPYFVTTEDGSPVVFGAIWERWQQNEQPPMDSCTILTKEPIQALSELHHRMPLMLTPDVAKEWLEGDQYQAEDIARHTTPNNLKFYKVGRAVGNVRNDGAELIQAI